MLMRPNEDWMEECPPPNIRGWVAGCCDAGIREVVEMRMEIF